MAKIEKVRFKHMLFFILKLKTTSDFFLRPLVLLYALHHISKDWDNTEKWGKKVDFPNWHSFMPYDIRNALSFITEQKSQPKTKIDGLLCPQGSKIGLQNLTIVVRAYF